MTPTVNPTVNPQTVPTVTTPTVPTVTTLHAQRYHWANVHYQGGSVAQARAHQVLRDRVKSTVKSTGGKP